ncbi:hypothetical protein FRB95_006787 [Tulasnella sp. JGI-2019a]|nr:hypothetical protein FRB95_006787 [Tulasnella sp. JGI-2019a]
MSGDWQQSPSFTRLPDSPEFKAVYDGQCNCRRIKFKVGCQKPLDAQFCHCLTCQSLHGAPFQWAAIVHKTDVFFTNGAEGIHWYQSRTKQEGHILPSKASCSYCHSPILDDGRNMVMLFPTLIHFPNAEEQKEWNPTCHIFYTQRAYDIVDGKPKWSAHKNGDDSELLDNYGNPIANR